MKNSYNVRFSALRFFCRLNRRIDCNSFDLGRFNVFFYIEIFLKLFIYFWKIENRFAARSKDRSQVGKLVNVSEFRFLIKLINSKNFLFF